MVRSNIHLRNVREKAKRQKQIEKSPQRLMAKKDNAALRTETAGTGAEATDPENGAEHLEESRGNPDRA